MVHLLRAFSPALALLLLTAFSCTPPSTPPPPPTAPVMVSGRVVGNQACGPVVTASWGLIGAFGCVMPTTAPTAFLLTPLIRNTPNGPVPNEVAILTVTTQSLKNLDIGMRFSKSGSLFPQRQFPDGPGAPVPQVLGNYGEVAVAANDDGTTKTWKLQVRLSPCREVVFLEIAAVTPGGPSSSTHLDVVLLRNANEVQQTGCPPQMSRASLASIAPTHGAPGKMVTLTGSGFSSQTVQVKFGNIAPIPATLDATRTTTTVAVPQAVFGPVNVSIIDPAYGQTTAVGFTITGATPAINSIAPGSAQRGARITLTGSNFGSGMVIQFVPSAASPPVPPIVPESLSGTAATFRVPLVNFGSALVTIGYTGETFSNGVYFTVVP